MAQYKYTDEDIIEAVRICKNVTDVMRHLGVKLAGGNWTHINNRIIRSGADISHFGDSKTRGALTPGLTNKKEPYEILRIYPTGTRRIPHYQLKRAILDVGFVYQCSNEACLTTGGMWRGRDLTLQVDHIDGNALDSRRENLRFLCPNCHTQTDSYAGKNRGSRCACGAKRDRRSRRCRVCYREELPKPFQPRPETQKIQWPPLEELLTMLANNDNNYSALGRTLGVSDNAIRKHIKRRDEVLRKHSSFGN